MPLLIFSLTTKANSSIKNKRKKTFNRSKKIKKPKKTSIKIKNDSIKNNWQLLIQAIAKVESENNPKAISRDCVGLLQLRPIYVNQVNKILGRRKYTLNDRFNPTKSIEMFNIYQTYYNPKHNLNIAIRLHNRGNNYYNKILNEMFKLKNSPLNNTTIIYDSINDYHNDILVDKENNFLNQQ